MNRPSGKKHHFILIIWVALSSASFAQTKDCYPNSSVSFDVIARERIPSITSVEAIGTQCRVDADKKLAEYRKEDERNFNFLKNKYFAAMSGWVQTGDCEHGGPPPCCTAPSASVPWAVVGAEKAKATLMAEWHKVQYQRQQEVEKQMHDCLAGLKSAGIDKFNDLYAQANDCLKGLQGIKVVAEYNKDLVVGYVNQLNDIHAQMQVMAGKTTPDPTTVMLLANNMVKLQAEICNKLTELNHPVKNNPHTGTAMGVRAEVVKPKVESQAITNNSQQQLNMLAAVKEQKVNAINKAYNSVSDVLGDMVKNMVDKSIKEHADRRDQAFIKLENQVKTEHGQLVDCKDCNGAGTIQCTDCNGKGYNECVVCKGTGIVNGSKCAQCFGTGKNICMKCDGLGSYQCSRCQGTGKIFEVDYSYHENTFANSPVAQLNTATYIQPDEAPTHPPIKAVFVTKKPLNPDQQKIIEIEKWIVGKLIAYPGNTKIIEYENGAETATTFSKTSIDETKTDQDILTFKEEGRTNELNYKEDDGSVTPRRLTAASIIYFSIRWLTIKSVKVYSASDTTFSGDSRRIMTGIVSIEGKSDFNRKLTTYKKDGSIERERTTLPGDNKTVDGIYEDGISFIIDSNGEANLIQRLNKAFNDLILLYKKQKPKELY